MSVYNFKKDECDCPICSIYNLYMDDLLNCADAEELGQYFRGALINAFEAGQRDVLLKDLAFKSDWLEELEED